MAYETLAYDLRPDGVATLRLNRPEAKNAMNGTMYDEARALVAQVDRDPAVRVVVLTGTGSAFCSGGDFKYQQSQAARPEKERLAEASKLALWLGELDRLSKPVIGRINGPAYGGGIGMISVCDIAIGVEGATFALTEVGLGLLPANIAPYVVARMGAANSRRTMLTARRMTALEAKSFGLLNDVVSPADLDAAVEREIADVLRCAPGAVAATKKLIAFVDSHDLSTSMVYTADRLADAWDSTEGQEGVACFFEKRTPPWRKS